MEHPQRGALIYTEIKMNVAVIVKGLTNDYFYVVESIMSNSFYIEKETRFVGIYDLAPGRPIMRVESVSELRAKLERHNICDYKIIEYDKLKQYRTLAEAWENN